MCKNRGQTTNIHWYTNRGLTPISSEEDSIEVAILEGFWESIEGVLPLLHLFISMGL